VCAILAVSPSLSAGQDPGINYDTARAERRLEAVRVTGRIDLDGRLDEGDWRGAPVARNFVQKEPREGQPASEDTEVRVLYDDDRLYVGVFAHDAEPGAITTNDLKKDFSTTNNDIFEVVLDTFHDGRNGYQFATNAMGAKWDAQTVNDGRQVNSDWDGIWDVRTRIGEDGWYAEIEIPFRTLRFSNAPNQTWGVNFLRRIRRRNEDSFWSPLPRMYNITRVSLAGTLEGMRGLRSGNDLRIKPYLSTAGSRVGAASTRGDVDAGVDVKYGVTSGLTWDFTVNTDFSQVEADTQQVNLTRFSLFFPEKREFFLENSGVFQFGPSSGGAGGGGAARQNQVPSDLILFFSRNIGLSESAQAIPIMAGTRLTGRAGPYSLGVLNIQQSEQDASRSTNFTALRLRRNVFRNSDIGVMFLNKDADGAEYNRAIGADANFRPMSELDLNAYVAKTFSPASQFAAAAPGRDSEDTAAYGGFNYNSRTWDVWANYTRIGSRFNDEMGFVPRLGISKAAAYAGYSWRPQRTSGWLREIRPHWQLVNVDRIGGGLESRYVDWHLPFTLQDGTFLEIGTNPTTEQLYVPFRINRRRDISIPAGRYDYNEYFFLARTNASARFAVNARWAVGDFYDGDKRTYELGGTVNASERLNATLSVSRNEIDLAGGSYTTNLITSRINMNMSTRMFLNALIQYNTDARQWSSNIRFNIIHRPLSDFFLVFNENRDSRTNDLLDRAVIAKMTYMLAF
jgi:hypothetical protein